MASDVRAASENGTVIEATEMLAFAWPTLGPDARKVLSRQYIAENPHPEGERYKLDAVDDNSYYARDHRAFHDWAKRFRDHFGYYDVFVISPAGDVIYTVAKESDFATNLKTGPYRKSPLADVFRRAVANPAEAVTISDFAHYPPSDNAPAGFAGHAIEKDGKVIGVFAVQIPAEPLNALMRFTAGMGRSTRRRFSAKRSLRSWLPLQFSLALSLACWCCCSIGLCGRARRRPALEPAR